MCPQFAKSSSFQGIIPNWPNGKNGMKKHCGRHCRQRRWEHLIVIDRGVKMFGSHPWQHSSRPINSSGARTCAAWSPKGEEEKAIGNSASRGWLESWIYGEDIDSETCYAWEAEARELWTAVLITNNLH
ncbi:hypothetical protein B0H14DRAFT_2571601 [Mycena olivaceomarginata]|nr:hypothetical protein B0H14DRAFT_2571601 [Mycena olivaceomarginata]